MSAPLHRLLCAALTFVAMAGADASAESIPAAASPWNTSCAAVSAVHVDTTNVPPVNVPPAYAIQVGRRQGNDDTARCNRLLARALRDVHAQPDSADEAIVRAAVIAEAQGYVRGMATAALLRGMRTALRGHGSDALEQLRGALPLAQRLGSDSVAAAIHLRTGETALLLRKLDSAAIHLRTADRLWSECRDADGRARSLHYMRIAAGFMNMPGVQDSVLLELRALYEVEGSILARVFLLSETAERMMRAGDMDSAIQYCLAGLDLASEAGDQSAAAGLYLLLGNIHNRAGRFEQAIACFQRTITIHRTRHDRRFLYSAMNNLAVVYYKLGDYRNAIAVLLDAKDLAEKIGNPSFQKAALDNIGLMYAETGEEEKAMRFFAESLTITARHGLEYESAVTHMNIGLILMDRGRSDSALFHFDKAVAQSRAQGRDFDIAEALMHRGDALLALGRLSDARASYAESLMRMQSAGDVHGTAEALLHFADADRAAGRIDTAILRSERALAIADSTRALNLEGEALRRLTLLYEDAGNARRAYEAQVRYTAVQDSMLSREKVKEIRELSARYEAEQRDKEIAMQRRDLALRDLDLARQQEELLRRRIDVRHRAQTIALLEKQGSIERLVQERNEAMLARQRSEAKRQKEQAELLQTRNRLQGVKLDEAAVNRNIMFGGLAVLVVIIGLLSRRYRERRRSGEEIARALAKLRRTQDQLIHAEKMGTLGEMTAGIAHEIRNPMNFISNFAQAARELSDDARDAIDREDGELDAVLGQLETAAEKIADHSRRAENIIAGMLLHARSQAGVREMRDVNPVIEKYVQLVWQGYRAQHPGTRVELEFVPDRTLGAVEMIPQEIARVVMNIAQNALHAVEQKQRTARDDYAPRVHIATYSIPAGAEIRVYDNGPGIPPELRSKIFQPFFTTKTTGEGTGLGLSMAYDIVVKGHGGSIDFTSRPGQDTTFIIRLPVKGDT